MQEQAGFDLKRPHASTCLVWMAISPFGARESETPALCKHIPAALGLRERLGLKQRELSCPGEPRRDRIIALKGARMSLRAPRRFSLCSA
ncbi:MAG: hypothetical protein BGP16_11595 [Sphingobium sp. 66-54]|nr:MAG: hypothetical protein BGP16_11595 [Sphingobium sp. 66-54]